MKHLHYKAALFILLATACLNLLSQLYRNNANQTVIFQNSERQYPTKSELIKIENNETVHASEKIFSHFYVHIPKTGGATAFQDMSRLMKGLKPLAAMKKNDKYTACSMGAKVSDSPNFFQETYATDRGGVKCNFWINERPYSDEANHVYTVIRLPRAHVLSQYFHCTESIHAKRNKRVMQSSLDDWLDFHVQRLTADEQSRNDTFGCYDPINLQSRFVRFTADMDQKELMKRYEIMGDMDFLDKFTCAMTVRYTGFLPSQCNCTGDNEGLTAADTTHVNGHGVTHHGATFNVTEEQARKIEKLTKLDSILYEYAKNIFKEQVKDIEKEFNVVMCDYPKLRS